ncbi:MAG: MarR family transcriptional regulator [Candidatus Bathyarchaeota archaeon]|nr:MAG: MarR family transcriptional regulator [Candidatus Bathyarchaeota archaeon]
MRVEGGFLVSKVHQLSGRVFNRLLRERGIEFNSAQGRILFALWKQDGVSISDLAGETLLSKSTLTSMLDRLEEAGHVRREPSPGDRRATLIFLTERNRLLKDNYDRVSEEMADLYYEGFTADEIAVFEDALRRILENLLRHNSYHAQ